MERVLRLSNGALVPVRRQTPTAGPWGGHSGGCGYRESGLLAGASRTVLGVSLV